MRLITADKNLMFARMPSKTYRGVDEVPHQLLTPNPTQLRGLSKASQEGIPEINISRSRARTKFWHMATLVQPCCEPRGLKSDLEPIIGFAPLS